ncbi:MAG TPA: hypothetical protein VFO19_13955 [Vicinamibacterales bacterium]|nr:hypothetical protein [Vicinamibacterales bacterium]
MRALRCLAFAGAIVLAGCSSDDSGGLPIRPSPGPTPQPSGIQITGTVIGHEGPGSGSPKSAEVWPWFERDSGAGTGGRHQAGANGAFTITAPLDTRAVRLLARTGDFLQPCLVTLRLAGGATSYAIDVHLVRESALPQLRTFGFVRGTVEGFVFEATPTGRRGVSGAAIVVDGLGGDGLVLADTISDPEGRFLLCGLEDVTPTAALFVVKAGYTMGVVNLPSTPEAIEIELKR